MDVTLERYNMTNVEWVKRYSNTRGLEFAGCTFSKCDMSPLSDMCNLRSLVFTSCNFQCKLSEMRLSLINLLYIEHSKIEDITFVKGLVNLEDLNVSYNRISDLSPLDQIGNLRHLNISSNRISSLEPLRHMRYLKTIIAYNNLIDNTEPLRCLTLSYIDLGNNLISDISPIMGIESSSRRMIYCYGNLLKSIPDVVWRDTSTVCLTVSRNPLEMWDRDRLDRLTVLNNINFPQRHAKLRSIALSSLKN